MNKVYKSEQQLIVGFLIWFVEFFLLALMISIIISIKHHFDAYKVAAFIITLLMFGLLLWIWFGTYYVLSKKKLMVYTGPFKWRIYNKEISKIKLNQEIYGGTKASLSLRGIEIIYGKSKSILISPRKSKRFLNDITGLNNNIEIKES